MITSEEFLNVLQKELEPTTGCTDPAAIALASSRAASELSGPVEHILVQLSPNVYKNTAAVGVPGTHSDGAAVIRGGAIAAALGSQLVCWQKGLSILDEVNESTLQAALNLEKRGGVEVKCISTPDPLYIVVTVRAGEQKASTIIAGDYSHISEVRVNDHIIVSEPKPSSTQGESIFVRHPLRELIELALSISAERYEFLLEALDVNRSAARNGALATQLKLGPTLAACPLADAASRTRAWVAAAGEARMAGLRLPIVAITGSGNHGITLFVGLAALGETLGSSRTELARALAIGATVTTYIKGHIQRMTAFCGCGVAAATGLGAGAIHLLGGNYSQMEHTMQSVIGTLAGMLCDGAKESCAYKISTAAQTALQFAELAMQGVYLQSGVGILGNSIEDTFINLGRLNNPAMLGTDQLILELIQQRNKTFENFGQSTG